jgi:hypothetical protein
MAGRAGLRFHLRYVAYRHEYHLQALLTLCVQIREVRTRNRNLRLTITRQNEGVDPISLLYPATSALKTAVNLRLKS